MFNARCKSNCTCICIIKNLHGEGCVDVSAFLTTFSVSFSCPSLREAVECDA